MAENANESWRKPTNIQLLCLVLSTSSVQKAVPMNSENSPPEDQTKKQTNVARPLAANTSPTD